MSGNSVIECEVSYSLANKIRVLDDNFWFVGCGDADELLRQYNHLIHHGTVDRYAKADVTFTTIRSKGDGLYVDIYDSEKHPFGWLGFSRTLKRTTQQGNTGYITMGSGGKYAEVLFLNGFSAEDSVRGASKCDIYSSYEIDAVEIGKE